MCRYEVIEKHLENNTFKRFDTLSFQNYRDKEDRIERLITLDFTNKVSDRLINFVRLNYLKIDFKDMFNLFLQSLKKKTTNIFFNDYGFRIDHDSINLDSIYFSIYFNDIEIDFNDKIRKIILEIENKTIQINFDL